MRKYLINCAWHQTHPVYDGGNVLCEGDALEAAQFVLGTHVAAVLEAGHFPLVIGGGHEVAWGTWQGLATWAMKQPGKRVGVLNFDAHFDLRAGEVGTSGTPFRQIAEDCAARNWSFRYACFGVARATNTAALFARAPVDGSFLIDVLPAMLLLGLGAGGAFNPMLLAAMGDVEPADAGLASGVVNTSFMMGGALGLAVLASLAAAQTAHSLAQGAAQAAALNDGYRLAFLIGALLAAGTAALGWFALRHKAAASHVPAGAG